MYIHIQFPLITLKAHKGGQNMYRWLKKNSKHEIFVGKIKKKKKRQCLNWYFQTFHVLRCPSNISKTIIEAKLMKKRPGDTVHVSPWSSPPNNRHRQSEFHYTVECPLFAKRSQYETALGETSNEETCNYAPRWPSFAVYIALTGKSSSFLRGTRLWNVPSSAREIAIFHGTLSCARRVNKQHATRN